MQGKWCVVGAPGPSPGSASMAAALERCIHHGQASSSTTSSWTYAIMNKLWLGFDLRAAIAAPILHVNSKGCVEYKPNFSQVRLRSKLDA
ncbi:glutathione hydrolase 5 proenzyme-like [Pan paniscus]|uniref:glutathione hydrolase 5 proenzyme-like n=1 Tax=Pan paniscus TaxID=9597 RepID=UPI003007968B